MPNVTAEVLANLAGSGVWALVGIACVLIGTLSTFYGVFSAPAFVASARVEAARRDTALRTALVTKYSYREPAYTTAEIWKAAEDADRAVLGRFLEIAEDVERVQVRQRRTVQVSTLIGIALIAAGSVCQGIALLVA